MAAEAFDPFADDDDDLFPHDNPPPPVSSIVVDPSPKRRSAPRNNNNNNNNVAAPRAVDNGNDISNSSSSSRVGGGGGGTNNSLSPKKKNNADVADIVDRVADIAMMKEFEANVAAFLPSATTTTSSNDGGDDATTSPATDRFGFPTAASGGGGGRFSATASTSFDVTPASSSGASNSSSVAASSLAKSSDPASGGGGGGCDNDGNDSEGGVTTCVFVIEEEMSVIHRSRNDQCSVKVRGSVSLEGCADRRARRQRCDAVSLLDPGGHLNAAGVRITARDRAAVRSEASSPSANEGSTAAVAAATISYFRISAPGLEEGGRDVVWPGGEGGGGPLMEYACGDRLRPVPMLVNIDAREREDRSAFLVTFRLRVNPRNGTPLSNAVVLVSVPDEFDGGAARVSSGRAVGGGGGGDDDVVDANWSGVTRILSWKMGELHGGAVRDFEASFPPAPGRDDRRGSSSSSGDDDDDVSFPVLLRYDSEGSALSDVDLDFEDDDARGGSSSRGDGDGLSPEVRRRFRVYHREL